MKKSRYTESEIFQMLELNLRIRPRRRLKRDRPDPLDVPRQFNRVWSIDFMRDALGNGKAFRTFNVLDDYNRQGLGIEIDSAFLDLALCGHWIGSLSGAGSRK